MMYQFINFAGRTALCMAIFLAMHQVTSAQEKQDDLIRVYALSNASAENAYDVIGTMLQGQAIRMSSDPRTNSLIVSGSAEVQKQVEDTLNLLDTPKALGRPGSFAEVVALREGTAHEIGKVASDLFVNNDSTGVRIAVNEELNTLIITGPNLGDVEAVRDMINTIMKQANSKNLNQAENSNCIVRVTWLVDSSLLSPANYSLQDPHDSLSELIQALERENSFKSTKVLTVSQTSVQLSSRTELKPGEFSNVSVRDYSGTESASDLQNSSNVATMHAHGSVRESSGSTVALDIVLELQSNSVVPIKTSIVLPKNHPVAFSITDVGEFKSAVVVEIIEAK